MIVGAYGQDWVTGVLAEHVSEDTCIIVDTSGRTFVLTNDDNFPVLCGEIVEIQTEDGLISGRCGLSVYNRGYACPGHQEAIESYRNDGYDMDERF